MSRWRAGLKVLGKSLAVVQLGRSYHVTLKVLGKSWAVICHVDGRASRLWYSQAGNVTCVSFSFIVFRWVDAR